MKINQSKNNNHCLLYYTPTKTIEASTEPLALQGGYQNSVQKAPECSGAE